MALTQRLLIRQSQALVMTPQLMQAIKLLQLSNLDLNAYVENELERNPLLERSSEAENSLPGESASSPDATPAAATPAGDAQSGDWLGQELETSRSSVEEGLRTGPQAGVSGEWPRPAGRASARAGRLFGMVGRRRRRARERRIQSRSLRHGRDHARQP